MRWYSPPGATAASNSFEGTRRELTAGYPPAGQLEGELGQRNAVSLPSEPQLTRRQTNEARIGRPLNDARQDITQAPFPTTSPPNTRTLTTEISALGKHQERRSYHPNPPLHRSDWVMWAGNVPSDVTQDELREFFDQPLPPLSPKQTEPPKDKPQVYGGVSTVFLISRSNCAFVNFESEAQLEAATVRFNGQPIRPDDQRCPSLVCRVRRREDDLMAGVGAQRGSAMHIKWVKEQKARGQHEQADTVGPPKAVVRPLSVSSDNDAGEAVSTHSNRSRSVSITSTNSDILTRHFPQRYFILKSSTQYDLDLSIQKNVWTTQRHNEEILDRAYRTSKDVFLIFSANKSGEFYGYARVAGPVLQGEIGVPWAFATGSTAPPSSVSSLSEIGADAPDDIGAKRQEPVGQPSFGSAEPRKRLTNSMPNPRTSLLRTVVPVQASSSEPIFGTPSHALEIPRREPAGQISEPDLDDRPRPISEVPFEGRNTRDDGTEPAAWGRPFRIEWIRTNTLPFFRTRQLRNPWNHGREVKVSRDGTELEPTVGQQLLDEWDRPSVAIDNSSGSSQTTLRRRGSKSRQHAP
jgi:RNA recognition motif-containing protein